MNQKVFELAAKIPVMLQGTAKNNRATAMKFAQDIHARFLDIRFTVKKSNTAKENDYGYTCLNSLKETTPFWILWTEKNRKANRPTVLFFSNYLSLSDTSQQLVYALINARTLHGKSFDYHLNNGQPGLYIFISKPYTLTELINRVNAVPLQVHSLSVSPVLHDIPRPDKLFRFTTPAEMRHGIDPEKINFNCKELAMQLIPEWKGENRYRFYLLTGIEDERFRRYMPLLIERYLFLNSVMKSRVVSECNGFSYSCNAPSLIYDPPIRFDNEKTVLDFNKLLGNICGIDAKKDFLETIACRYSPDRCYSPEYKKWEPPIAITEADLETIADAFHLSL